MFASIWKSHAKLLIFALLILFLNHFMWKLIYIKHSSPDETP